MHLRLRPTRQVQRRRALAVAAVGCLVVTLAGLAPSQAVDDPSIFELDGNAVDGVATGDDWANIHAGTDDALASTGILQDPAGQTIFTGGSTKDDLDISGWLHSTGSVPDKNEITNAYAAAYDDGGDLAVYFGLDKYSVNGNSNVGFWFLQNAIPEPLPATGFGITHEVGDVLVLSEFTNGGDVSGIAVYEWRPAPDAVNGTLRLLASDSNANCLGSHNADACGVSNQGKNAIPSPWPYAPKSGPDDMFAKGAFFEGGVNLSSLFPGGTPCFSSFLAETRSSQSVDAVLKDFTYGSFPLCDAAIQIDGSAVNEVGDDHTFTVDAQKVLGGSATAAEDGTTVDVDLTASNGASVNVLEDTCASPGTVAGSCTVTFDSDTTGVITGHASATVTVGDAEIDVETDGTGTNSGDVTKRFVDARVGIDPDATNGIGESHTFTVTAEMDLGDGAGFVPAPVGDVVVGLTDAGGAANSVSGGTCGTAPLDGANDDVLDAAGQCTVTFLSDTAGTVTGHADAQVKVTTAQGDLVLGRATSGANGNTDDAVKTYVDGTLTWIKHDDQGALLSGATFWVCRTQSWNSDTASYADIADTDPAAGKDNDSRCSVVADDVLVDDPDATTPDADDEGGMFRLEHLALGTYTVQEKEAPLGFALDLDEETVQLSTSVTSGQPTQQVGGETVAKPFVDPALYKVIVLTCNTSTEKLEVSEVDEAPDQAGGVKDTLGAGSLTDEQQAYLCGLGGASYDNRVRGDHAYEVTIPKP